MGYLALAVAIICCAMSWMRVEEAKIEAQVKVAQAAACQGVK